MQTLTLDKLPTPALLVWGLPNLDREKLLSSPEKIVSYIRGGGNEFIDLKGNWQLIGKLPEVTEDQYSKLVEKCGKSQFVDHVLFRGHLHNCVDTAKESFFSKLASENIYFSNPLGEKPKLEPECCGKLRQFRFDEPPECCGLPEPTEESVIAYQQWQSAQEKVFNIDNTYLFEKTNGNS